MRITIYAPYARFSLFPTDLELIQRHVAAGDDVTVLTCQGELTCCDQNPKQQPYRCALCRGRFNFGLRLIEGNCRVRSFYNLSREEEIQLQKLDLEVGRQSQLAELYVDNFDIGWAVLSSLISKHRDPDVDPRRHAEFVKGLFRGAWSAYYSLRRYVREQRVDRFYVFNGRYAPLRAALRACLAEKVSCFVHEVGQDCRHYSLYQDSLPHDHERISERIKATWEAAAAEPNREKLAAGWYIQRTQGSEQSTKSYVTDQDDQRLPKNWDPSRRNVVAFNSSEDEFAAVGESWRNPLYESQLDGLQRIAASLRQQPEDLHVYLRVHPNLKRVDNAQTRGLRHLNSAQITVIPPDDPVSSYLLMQQCEKVLSFGSTAGIEATYWGKPTILAGMCYYRALGGTYIPESHEELMQLLHATLEPLDPLPAKMYGYYQATFGEPYQYYEASQLMKGRFKGRRLRATVGSWMHSRMLKHLPTLSQYLRKAG